MSELYEHEKVNACINAIAQCAKAMGVNLLELREACRAVAHTCDGIMAEHAKQAEQDHTEEESQ